MSKTFTLSQAADEVGCSKATIHRAIKTGKISALRDGNSYSIEAAELFRVFSPKTFETDHANDPKPQAETPENVEIRMLRELLSSKDELIAELRADKVRLLGSSVPGQGRGLWTRMRQLFS